MVIQFAASDDETEDTKRDKKPIQRRVTKAVIAPMSSQKKKNLRMFKQVPKWWQKASINYAFSHPHVTSRLERLMGSNLVCLTDRDYMQRLQERIIEDYADSMYKRIRVRENTEMERVKNLVLSGRIPLNEAPECMADHPIMMIEKHCRALIAARRAKIKIPKVNIPRHLYFDDTPDPPSGLSIENGHIFRSGTDRLCNPISRFLPPEEPKPEEEGEGEAETEAAAAAPPDQADQATEATLEETLPGEEVEELEEELEFPLDDYMFSKEDYDKLKYESPLIKKLRRCKTVEKLYALADEIIGVDFSALEETKKADGDSSSIASSIAPSLATSAK